MNINKLIGTYFEGLPAPDIFTFDSESINDECNAIVSNLLINPRRRFGQFMVKR